MTRAVDQGDSGGRAPEQDAWTGQVEDLDVASAPVLRRSSRRVPWWPVLALLVAVVAGAVLVLRGGAPSPSAGAPAPTARTSPPSATDTSVPSGEPSPTALTTPVTVTDLGHPLLGTSAGWELFARADDRLIRIQPALGRV